MAEVRNKAFFYLLLLFGIYIGYLLLQPFLGVIVFALVTVLMFSPLYNLFMRWFKERAGLATTCTILSISLIVLVPLGLVVEITIQQAFRFSNDVSSLIAGQNVSVTYMINEVNGVLQDIPYVSNYELTETKIIDAVQGVVKPIGTLLADQAVSLGKSSADWLARLIIFFTLLGTLFPGYPKLIQLLKDLSPLDDALDEKYLQRVTVMTKSMVRGVFVIALAQGLATGLLLWIAGVPYTFFWTVLAIVFSILPLGAGVIAIPIGVILLAVGHIWQGLVVILGALLIVSNIDNLLRPRLVHKDAELSPALVLLSAFGGIKLFGFLGVIYGPVIMIFLITTIEIYLEYYRHDIAPGGSQA